MVGVGVLTLGRDLDPGALGVAAALDHRDREHRPGVEQERGADAEVVVGVVRECAATPADDADLLGQRLAEALVGLRLDHLDL
jgi:hypothetical protein